MGYKNPRFFSILKTGWVGGDGKKKSLYIGPRFLRFIGAYPTISPRVVIFTTLSTCATKFSFPTKTKSHLYSGRWEKASKI